MYGVPTTSAGYPPQQQPPPPPPQQAPVPQQQQPAHTPGSYAARSAQAYASSNGTGNVGAGANVGVGVGGNAANMNMYNQNQMPVNGNMNMPPNGPAQQQQQQYGYNGANNNAYAGPSSGSLPIPVATASNVVPVNNRPVMPMPNPQQQLDPQQQQQQQYQNPPQPQPQQYPNMPPSMPPVPQQSQSQPQSQYQVQQPPQQYQQYGQPQQPNQYSQSQYQYGQTPVADHQTTLLNQSIRRMQEAVHIMRGAMEANDLSTTLDRASAMLGELGDPKHHHHQHHHHHHNKHLAAHTHGYHDPSGPKAVMSPKHYYELHMMALDELPNLEEYFLSLASPPPPEYTPASELPPVPLPMSVPTLTHYPMAEIYELVQYCPRSVPRLYLQICAGSALIRSGGATVKSVLNDLKEAVKCVQCPVRGLFLRHYLLQAMKDKLPDENENDNQNHDANAGQQGMMEGGEAPQPQLMNREVSEGDFPTGETETTAAVAPNLHTPAVDNLMGDLGVGGVDVNLNGGIIDGVGGAGATPAPEHSHAVENLMGGLGVNFEENAGGGLFDVDNVPSAPPSMPPPVPPPAPPPAPPAAAHLEDEMNNDPNSPGTVKDSYQFVLSNFIEMNKLWVRIQHMPGDSKTRETKRKRERERNELRMMVGTNLVRLSELEGVTSAIYGTIILPRILDQIVACHDPLAQAYLMDCIIQVFPDEFHIQTLEVVLSVCPKLREKVNIRTILHSIMSRLAKYYEDELLLNDEEDTHGVKMSVMMDSFSMFDECIKSVLNARGVKLTAREAIRLESSLLDFTLKCYPGQMDHIDQCLDVCAATLRGEGNHGITGNVNVQPTPIPLDDRAIDELEKLLSLPLEELSLGLLQLRHYSELLALLPWDNRKNVVKTLLKVLDSSGDRVTSLHEMNHLFAIITPLLKNNPMAMGQLTVTPEEQALVAKVIHILHHEDTDVHYEMLHSAKRHITESGGSASILVPLCYSALTLLNRVRDIEFPAPVVVEEDEASVDEPDEAAEEEAPQEADAAEGGNAGVDANADAEGGEETADQAEKKEKVETNDDLSYNSERAQNDDDISYDEHDISMEIKEMKNEVEEIAAQLDTIVSVDERENTKLDGFSESEQASNISIKDDLFADTPLFPDDVPAEDTTAVSTFTKQVTCRQICLFIQNIISGLKMHHWEQCFNLSIQAATAADCCVTVAKARGGNVEDLNPIAYTFFTEAFTAYEGGISDPKVQVSSISAMVGSLLACGSIAPKDYENLVTKVTQYAARLAKKSDQCKMVMLCSHLFYYYEGDGYKNSQRVLECLQRSLKVADMCMSSTPANLQLFVDILDTYLYHFEKQNPMIVDKYISGLIALVNEHINSIGANPVIAETKAHFIKIVESIEEKKIEGGTSARFGNIVIAMPN